MTERRPSGGNLPAKNSTYVYVNEAYSGELSSRGDLRTIQVEQPTGLVNKFLVFLRRSKVMKCNKVFSYLRVYKGRQC